MELAVSPFAFIEFVLFPGVLSGAVRLIILIFTFVFSAILINFLALSVLLTILPHAFIFTTVGIIHDTKSIRNGIPISIFGRKFHTTFVLVILISEFILPLRGWRILYLCSCRTTRCLGIFLVTRRSHRFFRINRWHLLLLS